MDAATPTGEDSRAFGAVLTCLRRAAGLTQEQLAECSGLSARGIGNLERGTRRPRQITVRLLVDGLGLSDGDRSTLLAAAQRAHQDARRARAPFVEQPDGADDLVGRAAERSLIGAHLTSAVSPVLLLTGEAGIGKSRLLAEARRMAEEQQMTVLGAACHRFGAEPYAPLTDALAGYARSAPLPSLRRQLAGCAWLGRLVPDLRGLDSAASDEAPQHARQLMFAAAARFLTEVAGRKGALLLLDDLQWASADGLALLATLVRTVSPYRIRVVAAYRDTDTRTTGPLSDVVGDLARLNLATHRRLEPLPERDALTLLERTVGAVQVDNRIRGRVLRLAGGLPIFLVQLGHALADSGGTLDQLPWGVTQAVRQQVGALPEETTNLLTLLAVGDRRLDGSHLAAAAGHDEDDIPALLAPARSVRLLDENADGFRLVHHVVAEVINTDLSPSQRHGLHRRLAAALRADAEHSSAALAYHDAGGQDVERASVTLRQAAEEATRQAAHDTAARYLADLVDLLDRAGKQDDLGETAEALAEALGAAGRYDAALAAAERALLAYRQHPDAQRQQLVIARIGYLHFQRGTPREGLARIAVTLRDDSTQDSSPAQLHLATAANLYQSTRYRESVETCTRAIQLATRAGDDRSIGVGHLRRGLATRLLGDNRGALDDLHTAASLAELSQDRDTLARALTGIAVIHHYSGELSRADGHFARTLLLAEELGDQEVLSRAVCNYGASALFLGEWKAARLRFERALALARPGGSPVCEAMALISRAELLTAAGRHDAVRDDLKLAIRLGTASDNVDLVRNATATLAEGDTRAGRPARAVARLVPLLDRGDQPEWQVTDLLPILADAHLAAGHVEQARRVADQAISRARQADHALALTDALRVRALVAAIDGEWAPAMAHLGEALDLAQTMKSPYLEVRVRGASSDAAAQRNAPAEAEHERSLAADLLGALREDVLAAS